MPVSGPWRLRAPGPACALRSSTRVTERYDAGVGGLRLYRGPETTTGHGGSDRAALTLFAGLHL